MSEHSGLHRALGPRQLSLLALGGAIGTGLFLGAGLAIGVAGPAVLVSYALAALLALALMGALAEMTAADPAAGAFGAHAARWWGPYAGYLTRAAYLVGVVLGVGTEVTAVAAYMAHWWPAVPGWWWVAGCSAGVVALNAAEVRVFGAVEAAAAVLKLVAVALFLVLGSWLVFGSPGGRLAAHAHYAGAWLPFGWSGLWTGVLVALFSFFGIEIVAVAAGEAADPARAVASAFKAAFVRLALFYLATVALVLALVPWQAAGQGSPFVAVMARTGVPHADDAVNLLLLVAALSSMNGLLYVATRMLYALAVAGQAPAAFARTRAGVPIAALAACTAGIALAAALTWLDPGRAFGWMMATATFMPLFTWGMIFATHWRFRRAVGRPEGFRLPGAPWTSAAGLAAIAALIATMPFTAAFGTTLPIGLAALALIAAAGWRVRGRKGD